MQVSQTLSQQIAKMVENDEDYVVDADGIDDTIHMVINDFTDGVWLAEHHGECNMHKFTRVKRLA